MTTGYPLNYYQPQSIMSQPQSPITWVQGPQQVEAFPVQYGGTVVLWDKEQPVIYIKSVDNFGNSSMQILDYVFRKNQSPSQQEDASIQNKSDEKQHYVTREDFDEFAIQIAKQLKEIAANTNKPVTDVNNTKPNRKFDKED